MKRNLVRTSCLVTLYQLRAAAADLKTCLVPGCIFVYLYAAVSPVRDFIASSGEKAAPCLFVFLFSDVNLAGPLLAGMLLFAMDAPFYGRDRLFSFLRAGRGAWVAGQALFVPVLAFLYTSFLLLAGTLLLFPGIEFSNRWGKVWTTLAMSDAWAEFGLTIRVTPNILFNYTPAEALAAAFLLVFLVCTFYGFLSWMLNLIVGQAASLVVCLADIVIVARVWYFPEWTRNLVPSAWTDLAAITSGSLKMDLAGAAWRLGAGIALTAAVSIVVTYRSDIGK